MKVLFASKANVGTKYLTKNNMPVKVLEVGPKAVSVESLFNGHKVIQIDLGAILRPYDARRVNPEALAMSKASESDGVKDTKAIAGRVKEALGGNETTKTLTREYLGKEYQCQAKPDGFHFDGKVYRSLTDVARTITGQKIINGPKFFGLRGKVGK